MSKGTNTLAIEWGKLFLKQLYGNMPLSQVHKITRPVSKGGISNIGNRKKHSMMNDIKNKRRRKISKLSRRANRC